MPDYITNQLRVHGEPSIVKRFVAAVAGDGPFDFHQAYPTPPEAGLVRKDAKSISAQWEWRWDHWDSSRSASNAKRVITDGGRTATYTFETAWNRPASLVDHLAGQYPDLAFKLSFFGDALVGFILWVNGSEFGALEQAPTIEARRLLVNTSIQTAYDEWIRETNDVEGDSAA
jgi:hypothetical protein